MARTSGNALEPVNGQPRDMVMWKYLATEPADQANEGLKRDSPIIPCKETVTREVGNAPKVAN